MCVLLGNIWQLYPNASQKDNTNHRTEIKAVRYFTSKEFYLVLPINCVWSHKEKWHIRERVFLIGYLSCEVEDATKVFWLVHKILCTCSFLVVNFYLDLLKNALYFGIGHIIYCCWKTFSFGEGAKTFAGQSDFQSYADALWWGVVSFLYGEIQANLFAPRVLLDYLRPMITIPSILSHQSIHI